MQSGTIARKLFLLKVRKVCHNEICFDTLYFAFRDAFSQQRVGPGFHKKENVAERPSLVRKKSSHETWGSGSYKEISSAGGGEQLLDAFAGYAPKNALRVFFVSFNLFQYFLFH